MPHVSMLGDVAENWWVLALRGILAILFGIAALLWPGLTLAVLVLLWGAFVFADGIAAVVSGITSRLWSLALFGLVAVAAGLYALFMPAISALALLFVIAAWAIARGILEIVAAIRLRQELSNEWLLVVSGAVSILFGVLVMLFPGAGALSVVWLIGIQALVVGALMLGLAFRVRGMARHGVVQ